MQKRKLLSVLVGQAVAALATVAAPVYAQDSGQATERVTITGSNISRVDAESASPVQVISREEIEKSGRTSVAELLQTLAVDNQGSVPTTFGNGFAAGASGISLRGLGAASTLTLVNGRRVAPYGLADDGQKVFTDLNMIPMEAVERIEILKDGASSIYGSDAIAGVVNIILRKDFVGTVAKVTYGASRYGDGQDSRLSLTHGFGSLAQDRYNVLINVEASDKNEIWDRDRSGRDWIGTGDLRPWGYDPTQALAGYLASGGQVASSSKVGAVRDPSTLLYQSLPGCAQLGIANQTGSGGGCLWDPGQDTQLQPAEKSLNIFARGTFRVSADMQATAR